MGIEEIQIGDWLHLPRTAETPDEFFQVTQIMDEGYIWSKAGNMGWVEILKPIPLTKEILVNNGFEKRDTRLGEEYLLVLSEDRGVVVDFITGDKPYIWISVSNNPSDDISPQRYFDGTVQYVHELQHALRLCNINKPIEI